jgi:uridine phosphorylase
MQTLPLPDVEAGVITVGRVGVAGEVNKRINTGGRVVAAVGVAKERLPTSGRVEVTGKIALK